MPIPTIIFGIFLSTFLGAAYHFFRGGSAKKIIYYLILSWVGFWLGDALAYASGWEFMVVGLLNAGIGSIFSLLLMFIGELLSNIVMPGSDK